MYFMCLKLFYDEAFKPNIGCQKISLKQQGNVPAWCLWIYMQLNFKTLKLTQEMMTENTDTASTISFIN